MMNTDLYIVEWMIADPLASNAEAEAFAKKTVREREQRSKTDPVRSGAYFDGRKANLPVDCQK